MGKSLGEVVGATAVQSKRKFDAGKNFEFSEASKAYVGRKAGSNVVLYGRGGYPRPFCRLVVMSDWTQAAGDRV